MIDENKDENSPEIYPATPSPRAPPTTPYFIPRRPRVVRMRDLSPDTRASLTREYFDAYDPWTGARIAATLGLLISLFALFLAYKSKFHRRGRGVVGRGQVKGGKTSLYLYEDEISISSSLSSSRGETEAADPLPGFRLQEVYVGGASSVVAALKVKRSSFSSGRGGAKRTEEEGGDASKSLPCSPLKDDEEEGISKPRPSPEMIDRTRPLILDEGGVHQASRPLICPKKKHRHSREAVVLVAKRPKDSCTQNTIVSIAKRQRLAS